jgi:hypothetical protein
MFRQLIELEGIKINTEPLDAGIERRFKGILGEYILSTLRSPEYDDVGETRPGSVP